MLGLVFFTVYLFDVVTRLQFIVSIVLIIFIYLQRRKIWINKKSLLIYFILNIYSLIILTKNGYGYEKMIQQSVVCGIMILSYFNLFKYYSIEKLWKGYMKMGIIFSYLGILQGIIYYIFKINIFIKPYNIWGISNNYSLSANLLQVSSMAGEPGMFAQVLLPAVIFTLEKIFYQKKMKLDDIVILVAYLWTFTAIAYFSLGVYVVLKLIILFYRKKIYKIYKILIVGTVSLILLLNKLGTETLKRKIFETFKAILNFSEINYYRLNLSSFALISNLSAAINSDKLFLGNGWGSIEEVYYRYFQIKDRLFYGQNSTDGYSLLIRIFSEFGLLGVIFILYLFIKNFNLGKKNWKLNTINLSVAIGIISYFIRGGSYFMQGIIIFFYFLILTSKLKNKW